MHPQLSFETRVKIETLLGEGRSKRYIARSLHIPPPTIRYELKEHSVRQKYTAQKAQKKAEQRRWRAKTQVLKVATNKDIETYVVDHLKEYWSPESIAGRLKYIDRHLPPVGKDAIYAYLESPHGRTLEQYLWYQKKPRRPSTARVGIPNRTTIDERPESVATRRYFGDWEGDFIVSGKTGSGALLVLVERKTRYVIIKRLPDRTVARVNAVIAEIFGSGQLLINSLTIDNDISFRRHEELSKLIGAPVYFCHPYHSWDKGTVEKMNQMIRRFVPKRSDVSKVSDEQIAFIEKILNNKPYKCLRFHTPLEVLDRSPKLRVFVAGVRKWYATEGRLTT